MSLDIFFKTLPKGVEVKKISEDRYWEYPDSYSEYEGDTSYAIERTRPILGLFIDGASVSVTNLFIYPSGYSISARCKTADEVINRLDKDGIKYKII